MAWTDERIALLKQYWEEGRSASQIAEVLGEGLSRNAVIGKAHRLGLASRPSPLKTGEPKAEAKTARAEPKPAPPRAAPRPAPGSGARFITPHPFRRTDSRTGLHAALAGIPLFGQSIQSAEHRPRITQGCGNLIHVPEIVAQFALFGFGRAPESPQPTRIRVAPSSRAAAMSWPTP